MISPSLPLTVDILRFCRNGNRRSIFDRNFGSKLIWREKFRSRQDFLLKDKSTTMHYSKKDTENWLRSLTEMGREDPFAFILEEAGQVSKLQEKLLARQPVVGESLPSPQTDSEVQSSCPEDIYAPTSPLLMISVPDSLDDMSGENIHQELFHTPPEESTLDSGASAANQTVQADTEMTDVGDHCGGYSEGRPLVDLRKGSDIAVSEMEVAIERTVSTKTCVVGISEMDLENELQLKGGLVDSKGKQVAGVDNVSASLPTVQDGYKQFLKGRTDSEDEKVCGGSSGVRQKVRTRSEDEELKDFEAAKRAKGKGVLLEAAENADKDAREAEDHQILRVLPKSLRTLPVNEPSTKGLGSELKTSQRKDETCNLNRNSKINKSAEEVSKQNSGASYDQKLVSLPMPLLEWIENTKKSLNSKKEGSVGQEGETSNILDLLKKVKAYTDDQEDTDENNDDLDGVGLLHILKSRGVTYPRPRWWSDEVYKKSKLKEFIN